MGLSRCLYLLIVTSLFSVCSIDQSFAQTANDSCISASPFCTDSVLTFPAGTNTTAEIGPNYGCLGSQPNPAWYTMSIDNPGDIEVTMTNSNNLDIDFIIWGPFSDPVTPCSGGLNGSAVDCSYSTAATETGTIPNAQTGEYYVFLITNFSNQPTDITFSQTGGTGSTDCSEVFCPTSVGSTNEYCGSADGTAFFTSNGGTAPFTYLWNDLDSQTTDTASGLSAGTYSVTMTDSTGCVSVETVTVIDSSGFSISFTDTIPTSCTSNSGSATITPNGGNAPYSFLWSDPSAQSDSTATGLDAGFFTVTVSDSVACTLIDSIEIIDTAGFTVIISDTVVTACADSTGSATVTPLTGVAPFTYLWSYNAQTDSTSTGLPQGLFYVSVTDSNGCIEIDSVIIGHDGLINVGITDTSSASCGATDGDASVTPFSGNAPFSYLWSNGQTDSTTTGLGANIYYVTVTDSNACVGYDSATVTGPSGLISLVTSTTDDDCSGSAGVVSVATSGGAPGYTYLWDDPSGQTDSLATGLAGGMVYSVTATDSQGCSVFQSDSIGGPDSLFASFNVQPESCALDSDAVLIINPTGGTGNYFYQINNDGFGTDSTFTGLSYGTYTLTVIDSGNMCTQDTVVIIDSIPCCDINSINGITTSNCGLCMYNGPSIMINEVMLAPLNGDGSIYGQSSGFPGDPLEGEWIELYNPNTCDSVDISCYFLGNAADDQLLTDLGAGFVIPQGTIIPPAGFAVVRGNNAPAPPAGVIDIPINSNVCVDGERLWFPNTGGWFAFWDNNGVVQDAISWGTASNMTGEPCNPNAGGALGCSFTGSLGTGNDIPAANMTNIGPDPTTFGFELTYRRVPDGGAWDVGTAVAPTLGTCNDICATPNTGGFCNGSITVSPVGGSGNYNFIWSNNLTDSAITGLCNGVFSVTITDASDTSCYTDTTFVITDSFPTFDYNVVIGHDTCSLNSGSLAFNIIGGGVSPYSYYVNGDSLGSTQIYNNLSPGTYNIAAFDDVGCMDDTTVTVNDLPGPTIANTSVTNVNCAGGVDGTFSVTATGGNGTLTYTLNSTQPGATGAYSSLIAGSYIIAVTDAFGCSANAAATISEPVAANYSTGSADASCLGNDGDINVMATGGAGGFVYSIDNGITSQDSGHFSSLTPGDYSVLITDFNGCSGEFDFTIGMDNFSVSFDASVHDGISPLQVQFTNTSDVPSGTTWDWDFGDDAFSSSQSPTHTFEGLGIFYVELEGTNSLGCSDSDRDTIVVIGVPNVFSPGSDGFNDWFGIEAVGLQYFHAIIYNRWGEKIYELNQPSEVWQGTTQAGRRAPEGVYYYIINVIGREGTPYEFTGHVTLFHE